VKLAVIPARGGSKRVPRKNIRDFCGKPMIAWSIETALASGCFDEIIVSTDDSEIADVAKRAGAAVPFMRPAELANDHTGTIPVVRHAIEAMRLFDRRADPVCCIYPTAPFLDPTDVQTGLQMLAAEDAPFAFTVTKFPSPIQRAVRITTANRLEMFDASMFGKRSQDLDEAWHDAGQMYWGRAGAWLTTDNIFNAGALPIPLPRHRVADIDTPDDWIRAELMFRALFPSGK
jgi:N-acylneuraminate cytidylyltransferase